MQPVVSDALLWQGKCRRSGNPDETKTITSRGFETISPTPGQTSEIPQAHEPCPDELLDDWMVSGPAAEPTSSD